MSGRTERNGNGTAGTPLRRERVFRQRRSIFLENYDAVRQKVMTSMDLDRIITKIAIKGISGVSDARVDIE